MGAPGHARPRRLGHLPGRRNRHRRRRGRRGRAASDQRLAPPRSAHPDTADRGPEQRPDRGGRLPAPGHDHRRLRPRPRHVARVHALPRRGGPGCTRRPHRRQRPLAEGHSRATPRWFGRRRHARHVRRRPRCRRPRAAHRPRRRRHALGQRRRRRPARARARHARARFRHRGSGPVAGRRRVPRRGRGLGLDPRARRHRVGRGRMARPPARPARHRHGVRCRDSGRPGVAVPHDRTGSGLPPTHHRPDGRHSYPRPLARRQRRGTCRRAGTRSG